jgi:Histidine kinase
MGQAAGLGMDLAPHVASGCLNISHLNPAEVSPGDFVDMVREAVETQGVRAVFSLGQDLTAARISLDMLAQERDPASPHLRDARTLVDRSISDTRTLSHLLHPPLLDEAGFLSAAKWYVDGFGQRSGITT